MFRGALRTADTKTKLLAFDILIHPILEYVCPVWNPFLNKDIKILQKMLKLLGSFLKTNDKQVLSNVVVTLTSWP